MINIHSVARSCRKVLRYKTTVLQLNLPLWWLKCPIHLWGYTINNLSVTQRDSITSFILSEMIKQLNQHLSKTVSTQAEHYPLHNRKDMFLNYLDDMLNIEIIIMKWNKYENWRKLLQHFSNTLFRSLLFCVKSAVRAVSFTLVHLFVTISSAQSGNRPQRGVSSSHPSACQSCWSQLIAPPESDHGTPALPPPRGVSRPDASLSLWQFVISPLIIMSRQPLLLLGFVLVHIVPPSCIMFGRGEEHREGGSGSKRGSSGSFYGVNLQPGWS